MHHDHEVSNELEQLIISEGINVITFADIPKVAGRSGLVVEFTVNTREGVRQLSGTHIPVAAGRSPNSAGIGLDLASIEVAQQGWIRVDARLETTAPNVWAIGE